MKRIIATLLVAALISGLGTALAIDAGESRAVIGADLTDSQKAAVYQTFGLQQGSVTELSVTNTEERTYLDGLVDSSIIGTKSISCVYIQTLESGEGLDVTSSNISWCTKEMYVNALVTAGIDDARVVVTSPVAGISGTAALTGIYKAYEDITGEKLDEVAKLCGTQELVITAELADQIGSYDAVAIVNELKLILDQTVNMTDQEVTQQIEQIADDYDIEVTDFQKTELVKLCRSLEKLDPDELKAKVESVQSAIVKLGEAQEKMSVAKEKMGQVAESVKNFFIKVGDFLSDIFGGKD